MICSRCGDQAVVSLPSRLCQRHFLEDFERRVEDTVRKNEMVKEGDRIAVAVSGGKDSVALLFCLQKILEGRDVELVAVTVDEGIAGYRDDTLKVAIKIAERLGIEQKIVSFREEFGLDLDEMVQGKDVAPCTFCGVFRKSALNRTAKRLGANKVATGHNLDDEAQSVMMNYLKGDIERLMRFRPSRVQPGLVPRIKPLACIPEKEIALYGMLNGIFAESRECPYARLSLRADVREMMNRLEDLFPGTKQSTMQGFERISELAKGKWAQIDLGACLECGEPCVKKLCKACELAKKAKGTRIKI
ncbi:tRNA 2-thiocytidine biosynthesis protein TtcA [uncultured archaeon]|nr:tRNA 2-thiocytidine biosynthesis protein TtcA [uncultured archaeon]